MLLERPGRAPVLLLLPSGRASLMAESEEPKEKHAKLDDGRQPEIVEEDIMEVEQPDLHTSSTALVALLRQAMREEGIARRSDLAELENRFDSRMSAVTSEWAEKLKSVERAETRIQEVSDKVDTSIAAIGAQISILETRLEQISKSGASSAASTAGPNEWTDRPWGGSKRGEDSKWTPKTIFVRGWAPFGGPTHQKVSREEAMALDSKVRQALGPQERQLQTMAHYVCNHQIAYKLKEGADGDIYSWKDRIASAVQDLEVRGSRLRVGLEQSPQRKMEYQQFSRALELLRSCPGLDGKWEEDGRTLRVYAKQSWQELGRPTPSGWQWDLENFAAAKLPPPAPRDAASAGGMGLN